MLKKNTETGKKYQYKNRFKSIWWCLWAKYIIKKLKILVFEKRLDSHHHNLQLKKRNPQEVDWADLTDLSKDLLPHALLPDDDIMQHVEAPVLLGQQGLLVLSHLQLSSYFCSPPAALLLLLLSSSFCSPPAALLLLPGMNIQEINPQKKITLFDHFSKKKDHPIWPKITN